MGRPLFILLACATCLWNLPSFALPSEPFFATVEMTATVTRVSGSASLFDTNGSFIRNVGLNDLPILPWNQEDQLVVHWEQHSSDLLECEADSRFFTFGGITHGAHSGLAGPCRSSEGASLAHIVRASGGISPVWDGWESGAGRGPVFDMLTGEFSTFFEPIDGLATDCCVYLYDPANDEIIGLESNGSENPDFPHPPVQFLWYALFEEDQGRAGMEIYPSQVFGITEWVDPETGETIPLGKLEGSLSVDFAVEWRSTFERLEVAEPGALGMTLVGLIGLTGLWAGDTKRKRNATRR